MSKKVLAAKSVKKPGRPFIIVGIGASAGGIDAITELLNNLSPNTGMAFVYLQHLDPTHESMLPQILSRVSPMTVIEAKNLMKIEQDHLYVLPPNKDMLIVDGVLRLKTRKAKPAIHLPVNEFFFSLAEKQKQAAIGIVLSGNGADGAAGLKAIRQAGGFTFAQDESAKFSGMPQSAIEADAVDKVLSPKEIAKELDRLSQQKEKFHLIIDKESDLLHENEEDVNAILLLLKKNTGVDFTHYKKTTIHRRIIRRMLLLKLSGLKEYLRILRKTPAEALSLYNDLLINVTSFFRDPELMDYLKKSVLPKILKAKEPNEPVRIWVPACSTGEEAYSLAILYSEIKSDKPKNKLQVFGTDLSELAINRARLGTYTGAEVSNLNPDILQKYFTKSNSHFRISKTIRDMCVFAPHNIFRDPPFSHLDIISCCNFLIYLDQNLQKKAIELFHYALNRNAHLILGKSETVGTSPLFQSVDKKIKIFTKKSTEADKVLVSFPERINERNRLGLTAKLTATKKYLSESEDIERTVDSLLLDKYIPACVIINRSLEVQLIRGSTAMYLEHSPGRVSLNILKMAKEDLVFEIRTGVQKVLKTGNPFHKNLIEFKLKAGIHLVNLEIIPFTTSEGQNYMMILFHPVSPAVTLPVNNAAKDKRVKALEKELTGTREDMRRIVEEQEAVNEELQSANEEIVSSNEELQSINEELETSKEELQSANEELMTVNHEMMVKNDLLAEAYQYSEAIFSTIREIVIVLEKDFTIKLANTAFYKTFRLMENHVEGQLLFEIGDRQWDKPSLRKLLDGVLRHNKSFVNFEIKENFPLIGDKIMLINGMKLFQNRQETILLAIEDITEHVAASKLVAERETWFRNMADNAPVMIWISDSKKLRTYFNKTWQEYTGRSLIEETGNGWIISIYKEDIDNYMQVYRQAYENKKVFRIDYRLRRKDGAYRWVRDVGKPEFNSKNEFNGFIGTCSEIHDQKLINEELEDRVNIRTAALQDANLNLARSNSELKQFAYVASHDLQEPLRKILTLSDRLLQKFGGNIPEDGLTYINKMVGSANRMTRLIDDLLNFSRVTSKEKFERVDLNEIIQKVLKDFELVIRQKNFKINIAPLPTLDAVPVQMDQLFHNLISNAFKFNDKTKPVINIDSSMLSKEEIKSHRSLVKNKEYCRIVFSDNGIGFDQQFAETIFVIFQRLHERQSYEGTGIGLALCRKIVNFHEGIIYAEGNEKKGACFHIILPLKHDTHFTH
jgi:two-component system, chemotaxis family, CheB/CheR fusion protein